MMNGYETVYTPERNSKDGLRGHECRPERKLYYPSELANLEHPHGAIICCDACGQHWFRRIEGLIGGAVRTAKWYKVRWYHFGKRRRIIGKG